MDRSLSWTDELKLEKKKNRTATVNEERMLWPDDWAR